MANTLARIDLHCHSRYSGATDIWMARTLRVGEHTGDPAEIYRRAKTQGMTHVTLTDRDTIEGGLRLAHHEDFVLGEEVTAFFPSEAHSVQVLVWGLAEEHHAEIQALRFNIHELVTYLRRHEIAHGLAQPTSLRSSGLRPRPVRAAVARSSPLGGPRTELRPRRPRPRDPAHGDERRDAGPPRRSLPDRAGDDVDQRIRGLQRLERPRRRCGRTRRSQTTDGDILAGRAVGHPRGEIRHHREEAHAVGLASEGVGGRGGRATAGSSTSPGPEPPRGSCAPRSARSSSAAARRHHPAAGPRWPPAVADDRRLRGRRGVAAGRLGEGPCSATGGSCPEMIDETCGSAQPRSSTLDAPCASR